MKALDKSALFSIFEQGDEQIYEEHGRNDVLKNPFVLLGMVIQGLESYYLMDMMYKRNYPEEYVKVREKLQVKYYTKLYSYLEKLPEGDETHYEVGQAYDLEAVFLTLDHLRRFFEKREHYEKCQTIKKYIDLVVDQVKLPAI